MSLPVSCLQSKESVAEEEVHGEERLPDHLPRDGKPKCWKTAYFSSPSFIPFTVYLYIPLLKPSTLQIVFSHRLLFVSETDWSLDWVLKLLSIMEFSHFSQ